MFLKAEFDAIIKAAEAKKRVEALQRVAKATPVDTGRARASWRVQGDGVVTDCEYVGDLNRGHSQQAPAYFIERAVLQDVTLKPNGTIVLNK